MSTKNMSSETYKAFQMSLELFNFSGQQPVEIRIKKTGKRNLFIVNRVIVMFSWVLLNSIYKGGNVFSVCLKLCGEGETPQKL